MKEAMAASKEKSAAAAGPGTQPSHPLGDYAGEFSHPGYGILAVSTDGETLSIFYNGIRYALTHYHYDVFEMVNQLLESRMKVIFQTNVQGDIDGVSVPLEPAVPNIVFTRLPARELSDRAVLEAFTGLYEAMGMTLSITLKGDSALLVALPGQPELELAPYKGTTFHVKGLSGYEIEFKRNPDGTVTEAVITQPGAVFTAKRR
jgi:hypothetical protein